MSLAADPIAAPAEGDDAPASKQAIFKTALRLFAHQGFAATGMRQISSEAGVNLATINYFYGSKLGLLRAILVSFFSRMAEVLEQNLAGGEAVEARIRRTVKAVARYYGEEPDRMIIALTELPRDTPEITDLKVEMHYKLADVLNRHVFDHFGPEVREHLPMLIIGPAMASLAASRFLFRPVLEKSTLPGYDAADIESYADTIAELFLNGLTGLMNKGTPS